MKMWRIGNKTKSHEGHPEDCRYHFHMKTSDEELCESLRLKIARALPAELMPEFQVWLSLEQDLSYARGRRDEAQENNKTHHFEVSTSHQSTSDLSLSVVPADLRPVLEKAALEYAAMSPSEFDGDVLRVGSTKLRQVGLIDAATWARVPANDNTKVTRHANGELSALVLLAGI
jgi:hypothetical protein